ncbi:MAG TPA: helix-turn-helix domain-containing protein [Planctomycetota bacterium]|nr:helix-turn-helix domain-containing protein [Planctomycetota bacterium]
MSTLRIPRRKLADISKHLHPVAASRRNLPGSPGETWSGHAIRDLRKRLGATQEEFAQVLGVTTSSVHRWEAERVTPDRQVGEKLSRLKKIIQLLDKHFRVGGRARFFMTPHPRLEGDRPKDFLGLPSASKRIGDLLKSMLSGDFS